MNPDALKLLKITDYTYDGFKYTLKMDNYDTDITYKYYDSPSKYHEDQAGYYTQQPLTLTLHIHLTLSQRLYNLR